MLSSRYCIWLLFGIAVIILCNVMITWRQSLEVGVRYISKEQRQIVRYIVELPPRVKCGPERDPLSEHSYKRLVRGDPINRLVACPDSIGANHLCQIGYKPDYEGATPEDLKRILSERINLIRLKCARYYPHLWNASLSHYGSNHNPMTMSNITMSNMMMSNMTMSNMMMSNIAKLPLRWSKAPKRVLTSDNLSVAHCWIPKMGSTFMHSCWEALSNAKLKRPSSTKIGTFKYRLQEFWKTELEKQTFLRYSLPYTISRNPWKRLVSVYRDKCVQEDHVYWCKLNFGGICFGKKNHVEFAEFLECVTSEMSQEKSEFFGHVETSYSRCGICDYPYKYVVLMENFVNETDYIFKQAGVENPRKVMEIVRNKTITPLEEENKNLTYSEMWRQISPKMIDKVRFLYRYELMLYDYPETPFVI